MKCAQCGMNNHDWLTKCGRCGAPLTDSVSPSGPLTDGTRPRADRDTERVQWLLHNPITPQPNALHPTQLPATANWTCPQCGKELFGRFVTRCHFCGSQVTAPGAITRTTLTRSLTRDEEISGLSRIVDDRTEDIGVRRKALSMLAQIRDPWVMIVLASCLSTDLCDSARAMLAASGLAATRALIAVLPSPPAEQLLIEFGLAAIDELIAQLRRNLMGVDSGKITSVTRILASIGDPAVPPISELLRLVADDWGAMKVCVGLLKKIGSPRALRAVIDAYDRSHNGNVRDLIAGVIEGVENDITAVQHIYDVTRASHLAGEALERGDLEAALRALPALSHQPVELDGQTASGGLHHASSRLSTVHADFRRRGGTYHSTRSGVIRFSWTGREEFAVFWIYRAAANIWVWGSRGGAS